MEGLICALLAPVGVRIISEILIVIFTINDTLTDVKNLLKSRS